MSDIRNFYPIDFSETDDAKFFFSVITAAKRKALLSEEELRYVDTNIDLLLRDALKTSHKSFVRRETAKELIEGVFRVLDSAYPHTSDGVSEILDSVKNAKLDVYALKGKRICTAYLNNVRNRAYHIEHVMYKRRNLKMDFILGIKSEILYTDIYRAGGNSTTALLKVLDLEPPVTLDVISEGMDYMCAAFDLAAYLDAKEVLLAAAKSGIATADEIYYNRTFVTALVTSALLCAYFREDTLYVPSIKMFDAEDMLLEMTDGELCEFFRDCTRIFINRKGIDTDEVNRVTTEIEKLYAFTVNGGDLSEDTVAEASAKFVREKLHERGDFAKYLFVR